MPALAIDSSAIRRHVDRLGVMHKSALPVVIRQTLNEAAKDVKKNTMPKEAARFEHRKPTFFMANSKVKFASGFDVNTMKAEVGFVPKANDTSHSVEDLEQQENGGDILNRSFIALAAARTSKSWGKMVKRGLTLAKIRKEIFDANNTNLHGAKNEKERFTLSAIHAGKGGFVLGTNKKKGNRFLMYINSTKRVGRNTVVNSTAIYAVKAHRHVVPNSRYNHFMRTASLTSAKKMETDFIMFAEKKLNGIK